MELAMDSRRMGHVRLILDRSKCLRRQGSLPAQADTVKTSTRGCSPGWAPEWFWSEHEGGPVGSADRNSYYVDLRKIGMPRYIDVHKGVKGVCLKDVAEAHAKDL